MPKFQVTVRDSIVKFHTKDFDATSKDDAIHQAENEHWGPETGWVEVKGKERIISTYIEKVETR